MKTFKYIIFFLSGVILFNACKKDDEKSPGNPVINSASEFSNALFGDSLQFTVNVSDAEIPLSTVKAQLFFGEEQVSETVIRTKTNGEYTGKIYVPFYASIPNGTATLKYVLQNINQTITEKTIDMPLTRPDYPYLTLVTETAEYLMERKGLYQYEADEVFPTSSEKGYIKAPAMGTYGNEITFGWENGAVIQGSTSPISFSNTSSGRYSITFNTLNYSASPFLIVYLNGTEMSRIDNDSFMSDVALTQGQEVTIEGIEDISNWWIDPDYFNKDADGKFTFLPVSGSYRISANFNLKYFVVEALSGGNPATLQADGTGAIWIIGEGIGKPSVSTNAVGWTTEKALCLAPVGNKKYQITVVAGTTITADNINFKFFHQKGWGGEFGSAAITTASDVVLVGNGSNGRDSGNLGIVAGKTLDNGSTYVFTVDLSSGNNNAVLTVTKH